MKRLFILCCAAWFLAGCGSPDPRTEPPKSRFLKTGETTFGPPPEDSGTTRDQ